MQKESDGTSNHTEAQMRISSRLFLVPLVAGTAAFLASTGRESECAAAKRWVEENAATLPSTLSEISRHRLAYRKAIFVALPRETKLSLWHEQLRYYSTSPRLTDEQRAFVAELDSQLDDIYGPEHKAVHKVLATRARSLLGVSLAREVMANLGVGTPETAVVQARVTPFGDCACSQES